MKLLLLLVMASLLTVTAAEAKIHTVDIEVKVTSAGGDVGAHFSRYYGGILLGATCFCKIENRDDDNHHHVTPSDPWIVSDRHVVGPGTYILDLSDWNSSPTASVVLKIDGIVRFSGTGSDSNYDNWVKTLGPNTRKTDDREIAVDISD